MNWDDLTILLAVRRGGSVKQAARLRGVDKTTISRRLAALERDLDLTLIERDAKGNTGLTDAGLRIAREAEAMEDAYRRIRDIAGHAPKVHRGWVRLTAVPLVVNHILLPQVPRLATAASGLGVELIAEARDLSLGHGDADIALWLARPAEGGRRCWPAVSV